MKIENIKCPNCGGTLEVTAGVKLMTCPYCNSDVHIDDGVQHIQVDNAAQAG